MPVGFSASAALRDGCLAGEKHPEIVLISDGGVGEARDAFGDVQLQGIPFSFVPVGKGGANASITQFAVRRYPLDKSRYEVLIELANAGKEDLEVELSLFGDGNPVDIVRLNLTAGVKIPRFYPNLRALGSVLKPVRVTKGPDIFRWMIGPWLCSGAASRKGALRDCKHVGGGTLLDEYLEATTVSPDAYPVEEMAFDVTVMDGVTPPRQSTRHAFTFTEWQILARGGGKELTDTGLMGSKEPGASMDCLDDVNIGRANKLIPREGGPIGDRRTERCWCKVVGGKKFLAMG
jgi:hypothetical protein